MNTGSDESIQSTTCSTDSSDSDDDVISSQSKNACALQLSQDTAALRAMSLDAERLLSGDALLQTAVSGCCHRLCIRKLSPQSMHGNMTDGVEVIRKARMALVRLGSEQQYEFLRSKLEGNNP